jgi:hypothetical protein
MRLGTLSVQMQTTSSMFHYNALPEKSEVKFRNYFVVHASYSWHTCIHSDLQDKVHCHGHYRGAECFSYEGSNLGRNWLGLEPTNETAKLRKRIFYFIENSTPYMHFSAIIVSFCDNATERTTDRHCELYLNTHIYKYIYIYIARQIDT